MQENLQNVRSKCIDGIVLMYLLWYNNYSKSCGESVNTYKTDILMINTKISKAQLLTILLFAEKHQQNIFDELGDDVVSIDLDMIDDLIGQLSDSMQNDTHMVIAERRN